MPDPWRSRFRIEILDWQAVLPMDMTPGILLNLILGITVLKNSTKAIDGDFSLPLA